MSATADEPDFVDPDRIEDALMMAQNLAASQGWAVFPCHDDKTPASFRGCNDATKDPASVKNLWRRHPGPLIGLATGAVSGIDVLDIDVKHEVAVKWLAVASKRIDPTRTYATRSGGHHLYFRHAHDVRNTQSKLALGVDTRGSGGYAIFWFASGLECEDHSPVAPWPAWLAEAVLWTPPQPPVKVFSNPENVEKAVEGVLKLVWNAREGERNGCLHWAARRLGERIADGKIGKAAANALLIAAARSVGLPEVEAQRTINSAWRAT